MTAPESGTRHLILPTATANQPSELDRINTLLEAAGLGRPLREPAAGLARVPLVDGADPAAVRDAMLRLNRAGEHGVPVALRDVDYDAATHDVQPDDEKDLPKGKLVLTGYGKKTGFAFIDWTGTAPVHPAPAWSGIGTRPVVALFDTKIRKHGWLTAAANGGELCWKLTEWRSPLRCVPQADREPTQVLGSHYGHATFITGLLRSQVPGVQILSFPVMSDDGKVNEAVVNDALNWLVDNGDVHVDLVLMAFGRSKETGDENSPEYQEFVTALKILKQRDVTVVAAAGNSGNCHEVVPASLADDSNVRVVSVGAGRDKDHPDPFSNRGDWVKQWRPGTDLVGIMPMLESAGSDGDGYARWSGTSFSAADYAGYLAGEA